MNSKTVIPIALASALMLLLWTCTSSLTSTRQHSDGIVENDASWSAYGGSSSGIRYVPHTQINPENVAKLQVAWQIQTGENGQGSAISEKLTFEATPIHYRQRLFVSTAYGKVLALDEIDGTVLWTFDPQIDRQSSFSELTSRGVSAWTDSTKRTTDPCKFCIVYGTIDARIIKLDALTGKRCGDFANEGMISLQEGVHVPEPGDYQITSPPCVVNDVVVVGSSIGDNFMADTGSGVVRGYGLKSGRLIWSWDPLAASRHESTGPVGAANAWSIFSADPARDMVYIPTGSASPDFFGGFRKGDNEHANSIVALRASTGEMIWGFQTVHHDLWDYDVAAQPALVDLQGDEETIPAVVQATKTGNVFVLHRETGQPLFPIEEVPVPSSRVPQEKTSPTQPFSSLPNLMGLDNPATEDAIKAMQQQSREDHIRRARYEGVFTPPDKEGTLMYPGNGSGVNWGSVCYHPEAQLLIANTSRYITYVQVFDEPRFNEVYAVSDDFEVSRQRGAPYGMRRQTLISPKGVLMNPAPWGTLAAVNLAEGKLAWEIDLGATGPQDPGLPNAGGSIVTKSGIIFIAATFDRMLRAYHMDNGQLLWETELPRCGIATPMSYQGRNEKQYLVICAGGHGKIGTETGDFVVAYALP
ncbi:MAG: pyrroloquinoline quinone-dependent dehydrogenase [Saprospiraceae bacterium]|nr:pyrroloquinoline quinone-dependent dehydrogenase [Saprospiraceae bacterium]